MEEAVRFFIDHGAWATIVALFGWVWKTHTRIVRLEDDIDSERKARETCAASEREFRERFLHAIDSLHEKINNVASDTAYMRGRIGEGEMRR